MSHDRDVATITIAGPVGCGKTLILAKIKQMLEIEFECEVVVEDPTLKGEIDNTSCVDVMAEWERGMIARTTWKLQEKLTPRQEDLTKPIASYLSQRPDAASTISLESIPTFTPSQGQTLAVMALRGTHEQKKDALIQLGITIPADATIDDVVGEFNRLLGAYEERNR